MSAATLPGVTRVGFVALGAAPWLLPLARAALPLGGAGAFLDRLFVPLCHRLPERTLALAGVAMPLCSRCAGVFGGLALGALLLWPRAANARYGLFIAAAAALMLLDVVTQDAGLHPIWHATRIGSGLLFGYAIGAGCLLAMRRAGGGEEASSER